METIKIESFETEKSKIAIGLQIEKLRQQSLKNAEKNGILRSVAGQLYEPFIVESEHNEWVCGSMGNGTPFDCWLTKRGTLGLKAKYL